MLGLFCGIPTGRKQTLISSITINIEKIFKASSEIEREIELAKEKNSSSKLPSTAFRKIYARYSNIKHWWD